MLLETDRVDECTAELDALSAKRFADSPRDGDWLVAITLLADIATGVGDPDRSRLLHDLLLPFRARIVVVGLGALCLGSAARYLGRLALVYGDREAAIEHLEHAVRANEAVGALVQLAHTQVELAQALGPGERSQELRRVAAQTAEELHLPAVAHRVHEVAAG